jgi:hypothetical protein
MFTVLFLITFLATPSPTEPMQHWLRVIAEWNPGVTGAGHARASNGDQRRRAPSCRRITRLATICGRWR